MALGKAKFKELRSLRHKKGREESGLFLIEGVRIVQEATESDFDIVEVLYVPELTDEPAGKVLLQRLRKKTSAFSAVSDRELEGIADTVTSQGIAVVIRQKNTPVESLLHEEGVRSLLLAFDAVADPGNLGSMIRTADWFGIDGLLIGENSVEVYNPKVVRSTMGGLFHLPLAAKVDLRSALSRFCDAGYSLYVTDLDGGEHFDRIRYAARSVIVFGNEAWGVSDQVKALADFRVMIRRYGSAESLNVGVACGIILSSLHRLYDGSGDA